MLAPILSIQSHVVYGHVGNSAAVFPLQRLGREVWPLMTVQFSSHTGYAGWRGRAFDAGLIDECVAGLKAIGALSGCAGLLTGYLGKPEIGEAALRALERVRAANAKRPTPAIRSSATSGAGLMSPRASANSSATAPLPLATIATPNAFELEWLTGERVATCAAARQAIAALRARAAAGRRREIAGLDDTPADALDMLAGDETGFWRLRTPKLPIAVNGAGDLFAALVLPSLARDARDARGAVARGVVRSRDRGRHPRGGLARTRPGRRAGGTRPARLGFLTPRRFRPVSGRSFTFFAHRRMSERNFGVQSVARRGASMTHSVRLLGAVALGVAPRIVLRRERADGSECAAAHHPATSRRRSSDHRSSAAAVADQRHGGERRLAQRLRPRHLASRRNAHDPGDVRRVARH